VIGIDRTPRWWRGCLPWWLVCRRDGTPRKWFDRCITTPNGSVIHRFACKHGDDCHARRDGTPRRWLRKNTP
jgi:hypothetical protein